MNRIKTVYKIWILIILFFILFLLTRYALIKNYRINPTNTGIYVNNFSPDFTHKKLGEIESIIKYGRNSVIAAHYPTFGHPKIDEMIVTKVQAYIEDFNILTQDIPIDNHIYKGELNIDYEVHSPTEGIISLQFTILENLPYYAHPNIEIYTTSFDLARGKVLNLNDIMKGKYLDEISQIAMDYFSQQIEYMEYIDGENFQHGIAPREDNYTNFILSENYISFIFQKYQIFPGHLGTPSVKIPYERIQKYLRYNFTDKKSKETFLTMDEDDNITVFDELEIVKNRKVNPDMPMVALTFDDGPYARATIPILDTLREHNSVATFFVLGNRVPKHEDIIQRIIKEGNEIGNHSFNHQQLTTISSKEIREQIDKTQEAVVAAVGIEPKIMRPTYGSYDNKLRKQVDMPMILWSIDTEDWKTKDAEKITNHVLENVQDGDIVLMHDIFPATAEAMEDLVPELINRGFQLVTVSELYEVRGEALEVGNIYSKIR